MPLRYTGQQAADRTKAVRDAYSVTEWVRKRSCNRARRAGAAASRVKVDRDLLGLLSRDGVRDDEEGVHCRWRGWCAIVQRLVAKDVVGKWLCVVEHCACRWYLWTVHQGSVEVGKTIGNASTRAALA